MNDGLGFDDNIDHEYDFTISWSSDDGLTHTIRLREKARTGFIAKQKVELRWRVLYPDLSTTTPEIR